MNNHDTSAHKTTEPRMQMNNGEGTHEHRYTPYGFAYRRSAATHLHSDGEAFINSSEP